MSSERSHLHGVLLMMAGDLDAAATLFSKQLLLNPDDWATLQLYCECVMGSPVDQGPRSSTDDPSSLPHGQPWPESSLLRLSGGLMLETLSASRGASRKQRSKQEAESGNQAAQALVKRMIEIVEATPEAGSMKLTMRGPYLASVRGV